VKITFNKKIDVWYLLLYIYILYPIHF
jgi:hypothetical protein